MGPDHVGGRKLRVLHVILHVNQTNGQYNEHVLPLVDEREISVCSYFTPTLEPPSGVEVYSGGGRLLTFLGVLREALEARDNDVIHVHAPQTGALMVLALLASLRLGRYRKAMVYTVQDSWYDYSLRNQLLMLVALAGFKRVIFCSRSAYESIPRPWRWLVRGRWRVVQNAADIDRVDRALVGNGRDDSDGDFIVLFIGRLEPVKDTNTLLRSFARIADDDTKLVMVGGGSLETEVREQISILGLDGSVRMTGLIPRDDVFRLCANADVLVSTSHGEGLPVAVIEAMAARCPVVLSDIPPHRELLDGEDFVQFVSVGDEEGFASAIRTIKSMSEQEREDLGERARRHVIDRYSLPIMHEGTEAVYRELQSLELAASGSGE